MGSGEREMDWMMAEYKTIKPGQAYLGSFTGKSVMNGGSLGRRESTGKGVYFTFRYLMHNFVNEQTEWLEQQDNIFAKTALKYKDKPLKLAIQGFGNVGSVAALEAYHCSYMQNKVVAVSDRNVTLHNEDGLDIPALAEYTASNNGDLPTTKEALALAGVEANILDREAILYLHVDVLFLAALEGQIRKDNVEKVHAEIIVEGANAPVTGDADAYFNKKGAIVIPDILANAGGVIVSYLEWLQGRETQFYTEEQVFKQLFDKMQHTLDKVLPQYFGDPHPLRENCYIHAVMKLSTILYVHGKLY